MVKKQGTYDLRSSKVWQGGVIVGAETKEEKTWEGNLGVGTCRQSTSRLDHIHGDKNRNFRKMYREIRTPSRILFGL